MKNHSIKYFDTNNSKVCTSVSFIKAVFQNTIVKLCWRPLSEFLTAIRTRTDVQLHYFHRQWGFAICNKQRQKFVNECLRLFASAISTNFIYFFDLCIFPACVTIHCTGNLYTAKIISIKIIIIHAILRSKLDFSAYGIAPEVE